VLRFARHPANHGWQAGRRHLGLARATDLLIRNALLVAGTVDEQRRELAGGGCDPLMVSSAASDSAGRASAGEANPHVIDATRMLVTPGAPSTRITPLPEPHARVRRDDERSAVRLGLRPGNPLGRKSTRRPYSSLPGSVCRASPKRLAKTRRITSTIHTRALRAICSPP